MHGPQPDQPHAARSRVTVKAALLYFLRRRWWVLLAGCGLMLVYSGYRSWAMAREPELVVRQFVEALKRGDQATALTLLTTDQQLAARQTSSQHLADWVPSPDLRCVVRRTECTEDFAVVHVALVEQGYVLNPEILLDRSPEGAWRIAAIGNLQMDPRWVREEQKRHAEADERLAQDLESTLRNRPGVLVEREGAAHTRRL